MNKPGELLNSIFDESEIDTINSTKYTSKNHPVKRLFNSTNDTDSQVLANTERALRYILIKNQSWVYSQKNRLLDTLDYSTSSAFLAEIRVFGYLLETGVELDTPIVATGSTNISPDFTYTRTYRKKTDKVIFEVGSKQIDNLEAQGLEDFLKKPKPSRVSKKDGIKIETSEHHLTPFGKPKSGENVTENVIHKVCQIKQKEHQLSSSDTSILFLDFQDEDWNMLGYGNSIPISSWNGSFYSGGIWYAFYGWNGAPIFEGPGYSTVKMRHNGRYYLKDKKGNQLTKVDAAILLFPRKTIILENPLTKKPIKNWLWDYLLNLPWFAYEHSYINYPKKNLNRKIKLDIENINFIDKKFYNW